MKFKLPALPLFLFFSLLLLPSLNGDEQEDDRPILVLGALSCSLNTHNNDFFYGAPMFDYEENDYTCCNDVWYRSIGSSDPITSSASRLLDPPAACTAKLTKFAKGICSRYQGSFSESRKNVDVLRPCDSFCDNLLSVCDETYWKEGLGFDHTTQIKSLYGGKGDFFCDDLFFHLTRAENAPTSGQEHSIAIRSSPASQHMCFDDQKTECGEDDIIGFYTECNDDTVTRSYIYEYAPHSECAGGLSPPRQENYLPCHLQCPGGSYLPPASGSCRTCKAGTFSIGGGDTFNQWKERPRQFDTYCKTNTGDFKADDDDQGTIILDGNCRGWLVNDTFIESSAILSDSQTSVLQYPVNLVQPGNVTFTFKVDAEKKKDGLKFKIDQDTVFRYTMNPAIWETRTFDLPPGTHILKWMFYKDASESKGLDQAYIRSIEVTGIRNSDLECPQCEPGTSSLPGARGCEPCPANSFANAYGSEECIPCPSHQYSTNGSSFCIDRPPCKDSDLIPIFTPCVDGVRNKSMEFVHPSVCDYHNHPLPPVETNVPCAPCNPGQYRVAKTSRCATCPLGTFSDVGATECTPCKPGTYAIKEIFYTQFEPYDDLPGVSTWCNGDCATPGWRLKSDDIDSGVGHGPVVEVVFQVETFLEEPGMSAWNLSYYCTDYCNFQYIDVNVSGGWETYEGDDVPDLLVKPLTAGFHQIQIIFSKNMAGAIGDTESRLVIHDFRISGVRDAGAASCGDCPAGKYSLEKAEVCSDCSPGHFSGEKASECDLCPANTFASQAGASECIKCGDHTVNTVDNTDCDLKGCTFEVEDDLVYNLSQIRALEELYGPVWGPEGQAFYLNPCHRQHLNHSCLDSNNLPLETYSCMEMEGQSTNIGNIIGFHALTGEEEGTSFGSLLPERSGLLVTMDAGDECDPHSSSGLFEETRDELPTRSSSSILFICDPNAGVGYPEIRDTHEPCNYQFKWNSLYACPLCTFDDYFPVHGPCKGGLTTKTYVSKMSPNRCHSGITPKSEIVKCTASEKSCEKGSYFPPSSDKNADCKKAAPGFVANSDINADVFDSWDSLPPEFRRDSTWDLIGEVIRSGEGTTKLIAEVDIENEEGGEIKFDYRVIMYGDYEKPGVLYFDIDRDLQLEYNATTNFFRPESIFPLKKGHRVLTWVFSGGVPPSADSDRGVYAVIDKIQISGSMAAPRQQTPCREGTYQPESGQTNCHVCPPNTWSESGKANCTACPPHTYSLLISSGCQDKSQCTPEDYTVRYSNCEHGRRTKHYDLIEPPTCYSLSNLEFPDEGSPIACSECPKGFKEATNEEGVEKCVGCPPGHYLNEGKCLIVPAGSYSKLEISYFSTDGSSPASHKESVGEMPEEFQSLCFGQCSGGWRINNGKVESGLYSAHSGVDSFLSFQLNLQHEGSITFSYYLKNCSEVPLSPGPNPGKPGLLFYIDSEPRSIPFHPKENEVQTITVEGIPKGQHTVNWVYHQPENPTVHRRAFLHDIKVIGSEQGSTSSYEQCPEGTYSSESGAASCTPCQKGTSSSVLGAEKCLPCGYDEYSKVEGATSCIPCGSLINATETRTDCEIPMVFENPETGTRFNLSVYELPFEAFLNEKRFEINLFGEIPRSSQCYIDGELYTDTHICEIDLQHGVTRDGGRDVNVEFFTDAGMNERLKLVYKHGSKCENQGEENELQTNISFDCDVLHEKSLELISESNCEIEIRWAGLAGCPVCDLAADYDRVLTPCVNGVHYDALMRNRACNGERILRLSKDKKCEEESGSILPYFLGFLVICLCVAVAVFGYKNKMLADQYDQLVNSSNFDGRDFETDDTEIPADLRF